MLFRSVGNASNIPVATAVSADTFTQYALLAGRAGGQTLNGGSAASENLTLDSTSNATKGKIIMAASGGNVGIGTTTPSATLEVSGTERIANRISIGSKAAINNSQQFYPGATYSSQLMMDELVTTPSVNYVEGITNYLSYDPSASAASVQVYGLDNEVIVPATNTQPLQYLEAAYLTSEHKGSGALSNLLGAQIQATNSGAATTATAQGLTSRVANSGAGTITNGTAIYEIGRAHV